MRLRSGVILNLILVSFLNISWPNCARSQTTKPAEDANLKIYQALLSNASSSFKHGDLATALADVQAAAKLQPKRFEPPAMAAVILAEAGHPVEAKAALNEAMILVPANKRAGLEAVAKQVAAITQVIPAPANSRPTRITPALDGESQIQHDAIIITAEEAEKALTLAERHRLLNELLNRSEPFLKEHPCQADIWMLQAVAAMELNKPLIGWEAGQKLLAMGYAESSDPKIRRTLALLEVKEWLGPKPPSAEKQKQELSLSYSNAVQKQAAPTLEQTIGWMKQHFADLACDIRASGSYDATGSYHSGGGNDILGVVTNTDRRYGKRAAHYALIPLEMSNAANNILSLRIFELFQSRYSGNARDEQDYSANSAQNNVQNEQDLQKTSTGEIHALSIDLNSVTVEDSVEIVHPDFRFEISYLMHANPPPAPKDESHPIGATDDYTSYKVAMDEPYRTDIAAYQNNKPIYWLVIQARHEGAISDAISLGFAASGNNGTSIGISHGNKIHNYDYAHLPSELSTPPAFWVDANQDDTNPAAIKDWIVENCNKDLPAGQDQPNETCYPKSIAICNTDRNVLERWRKAFLREIELSGGKTKSNEPTGN